LKAKFKLVLFSGFYLQGATVTHVGVMYYTTSSSTINIENCLFGFSGIAFGNGCACYFRMKLDNISPSCRYNLEYLDGSGIFAYIDVYYSGRMDQLTLKL
jgi:hypothetical protein